MNAKHVDFTAIFCKQTETAATVVEWPELSNGPWYSQTNSSNVHTLLSHANRSVEKQTKLVEMRISENFHTKIKMIKEFVAEKQNWLTNQN